QHVEDDELRWDLGRELADAGLGGMQARLHRVEVERSVACDDDLAVECGVGREQFAERGQLREVTQQGPLVARPQCELRGGVLEYAPEAVPLRLVLPTVALVEPAYQLRLHPWASNGP